MKIVPNSDSTNELGLTASDEAALESIGDLRAALGLPEGERLTAEVLAAAAKKKGQAGQAARLAMAVRNRDHHLATRQTTEFNKNHRPPGPGGGQFASGPGGRGDTSHGTGPGLTRAQQRVARRDAQIAMGRNLRAFHGIPEPAGVGKEQAVQARLERIAARPMTVHPPVDAPAKWRTNADDAPYGHGEPWRGGISADTKPHVPDDVDPRPLANRAPLTHPTQRPAVDAANTPEEHQKIRLFNKMTMAVTDHDRRQSKKPGFNKYALPQYFRALKSVDADMKAGKSLKDAITGNFTGLLLHKVLKSVGLAPKRTGPKLTVRPRMSAAMRTALSVTSGHSRGD